MNDVLEIALMLNKRRYAKIYNASVILIVIFFVSIIVIFTIKYQSYYITMGTMIDNKLELLVNIQDINMINDNNTLVIDNVKYNYKISKIDNKLYRDDTFNNYKNLYLDVTNLTNIDNFVYEIKIPKENKTLYKYIIDYIKGGINGTK